MIMHIEDGLPDQLS